MTARKILFLDIDGVLTTQADGWQHMQPEPVRLVASVLRSTWAHVVLTSAWRFGGVLRPTSRYRQELEKHGEDGHEILARTISSTPDLIVWGNNREAEIRQWLTEHGDTGAFAVLDDDDLDEFRGHFVRTDPAIGVTQEHADRLIEILGRDNPP
jgi:HAD domain in Swiss Army Knife RNA repair proteins